MANRTKTQHFEASKSVPLRRFGADNKSFLLHIHIVKKFKLDLKVICIKGHALFKIKCHENACTAAGTEDYLCLWALNLLLMAVGNASLKTELVCVLGHLLYIK